MAATVIIPTISKGSGFIQVVAVIPTTVDASGATCNFALPGVQLITGTAISSNFNGKTLSVLASNDGTNFFAVATAIAVAASGNFAIDRIAKNDVGFLYYQLSLSGAPLATMTVTVIGTL